MTKLQHKNFYFFITFSRMWLDLSCTVVHFYQEIHILLTHLASPLNISCNSDWIYRFYIWGFIFYSGAPGNPWIFGGVCVTQSLVFYVLFWGLLFIFLSFFDYFALVFSVCFHLMSWIIYLVYSASLLWELVRRNQINLQLQMSKA